MGRLHPVALSVLTLFATHAVSAADYCSLAVRVLSADGKREEAIVSVKEKDGRITELGPTFSDVSFCDLGIEPVTVKVGSDGTCNQVVVNGVPLTWGKQYLLAVTYDSGPCLVDRPPAPVPTCQELLRVSDTAGKWIGKAEVQFSEPQLKTRATDNAGRALFVLTSGQHGLGRVRASGYESREFSVSCSRLEPVHEELIKLTKTP